MTIVAQNTQTEQYAVISFTDLFGTGYKVQRSEYVADAIAEGWEVIVNRCDLATAEHIATIYRTAGQPETVANDLGSLLSYDMTQEVEDRFAEFAQEFDLVRVPYAGMWIEGTITEITEDYIEIDGHWIVDIEDALKGELIARADCDCGFIVEYGEYLDRLNENMETVYAVALSEQTRLSNEMVA